MVEPNRAFYIYLLLCLGAGVVSVEVRGCLEGVSFLLPACRFQESNSGCQMWWQAPLLRHNSPVQMFGWVTTVLLCLETMACSVLCEPHAAVLGMKKPCLCPQTKTDHLVKWLQSRPWTVFPLGKSPQGIRETLNLWVFMNWRFSGGKKIFSAFLKNQQMGTCWESFPLGYLSELYREEGEGQALVQSMWRCNDTLLWLKLEICARVWAESIKI